MEYLICWSAWSKGQLRINIFDAQLDILNRHSLSKVNQTNLGCMMPIDTPQTASSLSGRMACPHIAIDSLELRCTLYLAIYIRFWLFFSDSDFKSVFKCLPEFVVAEIDSSNLSASIVNTW